MEETGDDEKLRAKLGNVGQCGGNFTEPKEEARLDDQCSEECPVGCDPADWNHYVQETTKIEDDDSEEINCEDATSDTDVTCEEEASDIEASDTEAMRNKLWQLLEKKQ